MYKNLKNIYSFIHNFQKFIKLNLKLFLRKKYKIETIGKFKGEVMVLANGPSLKKEIPKILNNTFLRQSEFIVMNLFALEPIFKEIKPKHYCFADPMFYQDYFPRLKDVKKTFSILDNEVDWEMYIYLSFKTSNEYQLFQNYSKLKNKHLKIIRTNRIDYEGFERFRNKYYNLGYCMPTIGNVSNLAIYLAIINGFKKIKLFGVDHNFFHNWIVNENNILCSIEDHFYSSSDEKVLKPIINYVTGNGNLKISSYMFILSEAFKSHDKLRNFANFNKVEIINMTKGSMIDSYKRHL